MTVQLLLKYLVSKLGQESESEVLADMCFCEVAKARDSIVALLLMQNLLIPFICCSFIRNVLAR